MSCRRHCLRYILRGREQTEAAAEVVTSIIGIVVDVDALIVVQLGKTEAVDSESGGEGQACCPGPDGR